MLIIKNCQVKYVPGSFLLLTDLAFFMGTEPLLSRRQWRFYYFYLILNCYKSFLTRFLHFGSHLNLQYFVPILVFMIFALCFKTRKDESFVQNSSQCSQMHRWNFCQVAPFQIQAHQQPNTNFMAAYLEPQNRLR